MGITIKGQTGRAWAALAGRDITRQRDDFVNRARVAASTAAAHGAIRVQDLLEQATTGTGERRVAAGGLSAGRHRTGDMIASVGYDDLSEGETNGNITWFSFGWFQQYVKAYFIEQDLGVGNIPPAGALHGAFIEAREMYIGLLAEIVR